MRDETQRNSEDAVLGKLPVHDVEIGKTEQIRSLAHTILARRRERSARQSGFLSVYSSFLEPVLVSGIVFLYLTWAVQRALILYRILQ